MRELDNNEMVTEVSTPYYEQLVIDRAWLGILKSAIKNNLRITYSQELECRLDESTLKVLLGADFDEIKADILKKGDDDNV